MKKLFLILALLAPLFSRAAVGVDTLPSITLPTNGLWVMAWPNDGSTNIYRIAVSNLFKGQLLRWPSTGGYFRQVTNLVEMVVIEHQDAAGVLTTNVVYRTNGIPYFPNGASASSLDVGLQTVTGLVLTGQSNTVVSLNSTGLVTSIPAGVVGAPLAYNSAGGGFTNSLNVSTVNGTGTGTGWSVPTNLYVQQIIGTNLTRSVVTQLVATNSTVNSNLTVNFLGTQRIKLYPTNNLSFTNFANLPLDGEERTVVYYVRPQLINRAIVWPTLGGNSFGVHVFTNANCPVWTTLTNGNLAILSITAVDTNLTILVSEVK